MTHIRQSQKIVTVCDKCLTESCWQGRLMCSEARTAGTITATEAEIAQMTPSETERSLAEDTFGRIERSNAAQDAFSRR
jgi:hypothetical protein